MITKRKRPELQGMKEGKKIAFFCDVVGGVYLIMVKDIEEAKELAKAVYGKNVRKE